MQITKLEMGLGGGEGSIINYYFDCGGRSVLLASSKHIKFSEPQRSWVKELDFMYDFDDYEDLKDQLTECDDTKLAEYIANELLNK